jgi:hypothetical protein
LHYYSSIECFVLSIDEEHVFSDLGFDFVLNFKKINYMFCGLGFWGFGERGWYPQEEEKGKQRW